MGAANIDKLAVDGSPKALLSRAVAPASGRTTTSVLCSKQKWPGHQVQGPPNSEWTDSRLPFATTCHEPHLESDDEARTLLESIAEGDRSAFWALWQKHQKHLFAVCLRQMGGIHADAEDALSKAMLKALDTMPRHAQFVVNAKAWLTRLASNVCIEMHREHSRRRSRLSSEQGLASLDRPIHSSPTPEDALLRAEIYAFVARTVEGLTTRLREPFVLRFEHEMSCREVGERLMLSSENVRKRIQQARAVLREEMAKFLSGLIAKTPRSYTGESIENLQRTPIAPAKLQIGNHPTPAFCSVEVALRSVDRSDFFIVLDQKPARQHLKLKTLKKYLERHPRGWKKRLETAYLLYTMGHWEEAIGHYRYVLRRQPRLAGAWINLANMLRLTHREAEAVAAYQTALTLVTSASTRHALSGLILLCLEDYDAANEDFGSPPLLDPANGPCWQDLSAAFGHAARADAIAGD